MSEWCDTYDVVVVGAGPAGSVAALQAARAGAHTLLVEKSSLPGGTTTLCGVDFPGLFHAWGQQVIAGIGWERVTAAVTEAGGTLPDFSRCDRPHWELQVKVNAALYACLLDEAFAVSGVTVLYHAMPLAAEERPDGVDITLAAKEGARHVGCRLAIDASGDADLVAKAGGRLITHPETQPGTPMVRFGGYDLERLDLNAIEAAYQAAVAAGEMSHLDTGMARSMAELLRGYGDNRIHVPATEAATSAGKTAVERLGRAAVLRVYRFLKRFPGLERLEITALAPQCGVRETAVIDGELTITADDYLAGRRWPDSLCNAFYQIDLHQQDRAGGLLVRPLAAGTVPTVPRRALTPRGSRRLLVAGRCVASDRLANSALRVQAACMAMGQAAGALAALGARQRRIPAELELAEVRALLRTHHAIVPEPG